MITRNAKPINQLCAALALALASSVAVAGGTTGMSSESHDAYREGQLWATYVANPRLEGYELAVDVQGDTATLTGLVDSMIERRLAERIALRTDGIDKVDNQIAVDPALVVRVIDEPSFANFVADATTEAIIESKLLWSGQTDGMDIDVTVLNHVATLQGWAEDSDAKLAAERIAQRTPGVTQVRNQLKLESERLNALAEEVNDEWISGRVKSTLLWTSGVDGYDIDVAVDDGVVSLSGTVGSERERALAIELARDIRGVSDIKAKGLSVNTSGEELSQR
jgi:osmotically-inducible protein OsmY